MLADRAACEGRSLLVAGLVESGSLTVRVDTQQFRFRLKGAARSLEVRFTGVLPEAFRDGTDVVVRGLLVTGEDVLVADRVLVRASKEAPSLLPARALAAARME